jgi:hypothetical protein
MRPLLFAFTRRQSRIFFSVAMAMWTAARVCNLVFVEMAFFEFLNMNHENNSALRRRKIMNANQRQQKRKTNGFFAFLFLFFSRSERLQ